MDNFGVYPIDILYARVDTTYMKSYTIQTEAQTRSKSRRSMTHTIEAESEQDAIFQARMAHIRRVGWNASVWISTVVVK